MTSPCIEVCNVDPRRQQCKNCGRTLDQITDWEHYSTEKQLEIMNELRGQGYPKPDA